MKAQTAVKVANKSKIIFLLEGRKDKTNAPKLQAIEGRFFYY